MSFLYSFLRVAAIAAMSEILPAIAYAQDQTAQVVKPTFGQTMMKMLPLFFIVFFIFFFMVIKPQEKKLRDLKTLLESLKKGESVVTTSGIIGRVAGIEKDYILLEVASNVRVKFEASHIAKRFENPQEIA